eukprot:scaffold12434_cov177-Amphora_coffeaeformis.AAC.2
MLWHNYFVTTGTISKYTAPSSSSSYDHPTDTRGLDRGGSRGFVSAGARMSDARRLVARLVGKAMRPGW